MNISRIATASLHSANWCGSRLRSLFQRVVAYGLAAICTVSACPLTPLGAGTPAGIIPAGDGQLHQTPQLFPGGTDDQGRDFLLNGQPAVDGKLILNASNGFFDPGTCRAVGQSPLPRGADQSLIQPNFEYLGDWKKVDGSLRWHFWIDRPGIVRLAVQMKVSAQQAGSDLRVSCAGMTRSVRTATSEPTAPQPWNLEFNVEQMGEHRLEISATNIAETKLGVGELHEIIVSGSAIDKSQLLRARWRPAAAHGSYASSTCPESRMWVMTTRSTTDTTSYSPITTPFGYFGTQFGADRRSAGGFNFSMWASRANGSVPPLAKMPHLLAVGSPMAEFSGFGHEGSGVKIRGWTPMPDRPEIVIQSLRVENDGDYHTYYGYFWDHSKRQWALYAVGRKWSGGKSLKNLKPGSFCEVPGPPHLQRTGDLPREVARRGWCLDEQGVWHAFDQFHCSKESAAPINKAWSITPGGEFAMSTGGIRYYQPVSTLTCQEPGDLPLFLSPEATQQLYRLPGKFESPLTIEAKRNDASVNIRLADAGTSAQLIVYYGEIDCLTFASRELHATERGSEVSKAGQSENRSWTFQTEPQSARRGSNPIRLSGLASGRTYYYRALLVNEEGQLWMFDTHEFRTP